mgnify:CR=1 FL=1
MRYPLKKIKDAAICAEIGVWKGNFSHKILRRDPKELHLIDPWAHQDYKKRWYSIEQEKMDKIHLGVQERFKNCPNVKIHRKFSTEVKFPKNYFDWVYVDGNHSYEFVLKDLNYYFPLIKKGGYLCGDDYGWRDADCPKGPKVAVDEFALKNNLKLKISGNQFVIPIT